MAVYGWFIKTAKKHSLLENGCYENGTVISVFGIEIYSNAHTDYNDLAVAPHSTEVTVP